MSAPGRVHIGTSGWSYDHWTGPFYPPELPGAERLAYYAGRLSSVEINNSFYSLPEPAVLEVWQETVPPGFRFAVKGSRYITHMKKLKDPEQGLDPFLERVSRLGDRLGPILFQLPPRWAYNGERLEAFLEALGPGLRYAFELRDHSWLNEDAYERLARHGAAFCIYDLDGYESPRPLTADFVYVRLHGPDGPYRGCYDDAALDAWAEALDAWRAGGRDVYCYFDNDQHGHAARNALALGARLGAAG